WSGLRTKISCPLSMSTTRAPSDCTLGRLPLTAATCFSRKTFFLAAGFLPRVLCAALPLGFFFAFFPGAGLPLFLLFDLPEDGLAAAACAPRAALGARNGRQHAARSSRTLGTEGTGGAG